MEVGVQNVGVRAVAVRFQAQVQALVRGFSSLVRAVRVQARPRRKRASRGESDESSEDNEGE